MSEKPTEIEAIDWLSQRYGKIEQSTAREAILIAERGLAFANVVNAQLEQAFSLRSEGEFNDWLAAEIARSTRFGKLTIENSYSRKLVDKLTGGSEQLFGDMPVVPGMFGDNEDGLRGTLYAEGWLEDATERFRMIMQLTGDETWEDIVRKAHEWAGGINRYYSDRFEGLNKAEQWRMAVRVITGSRTF